jgi:RHS repeat-associated protein
VFGFTGHLAHSPTGLTLAPFRAYDASLGRWISQDPIGLAGGLNLFAYVNGNPVDTADPLGLLKFSPTPIVRVAPAAGASAAADGPLPVGDAIALVLITGALICAAFDCLSPDPPSDPQSDPQNGQVQDPPQPVPPPAMVDEPDPNENPDPDPVQDADPDRKICKPEKPGVGAPALVGLMRTTRCPGTSGRVCRDSQ